MENSNIKHWFFSFRQGPSSSSHSHWKVFGSTSWWLTGGSTIRRQPFTNVDIALQEFDLLLLLSFAIERDQLIQMMECLHNHEGVKGGGSHD